MLLWWGFFRINPHTSCFTEVYITKESMNYYDKIFRKEKRRLFLGFCFSLLICLFVCSFVCFCFCFCFCFFVCLFFLFFFIFCCCSSCCCCRCYCCCYLFLFSSTINSSKNDVAASIIFLSNI